MEFSDADIRAFIVNQREELARHRDYLRNVMGWHLSEAEASRDWVDRYAEAYRDVGRRLLAVIGSHPRRTELFAAGMAEIMRYKFVESMRLFRDVGLRAAGEEWLARDFPAWFAGAGGGPPAPVPAPG